MSLRVLHVLTSPHLGGAEQVCLWLARAQIERGHDVRLLILMRGKVSESAEKMAIPVYVADLPDARVIGKRKFRRLAAESLRNAVNEFKPQLVHSHVPLGNLLCNRVLPAMGIPWIATVHGSWKQFAYAPVTVARPYLKPYLLLRHAAGDLITTRSAARIVAVSKYTKRQLESIGVSEGKLCTVLNGLPAAGDLIPQEVGRQQLNIESDAVVLGAMGYFAPVKGFDILIRAFAALYSRYPKLQLLIAGGDVLGDTSVRRRLERLIAERCPGGRARLLETLELRAAFFSALDIFAVSSRTESFHLGLAEAMQYSKPSVVTSAGGCVEVARPGREGLVFKTEDSQSLASQIETLILDPQRRESFGRAARERSQTELTLERCVREYEAIYHEIITSPHP